MTVVDTDRDALERMRAKPDDDPIVMLNLLRYRQTARSGAGVDGLSGQDACRQYGRAFGELGPRFGGEPIWMGAGGESLIGDDHWDVVILVRYPTIRPSPRCGQRRSRTVDCWRCVSC